MIKELSYVENFHLINIINSDENTGQIGYFNGRSVHLAGYHYRTIK